MNGSGIDFAAIPKTAVKALTSPAPFFREMQKAGGFLEPLVFMIVMGALAGIIQAAGSVLGLRLAMGATQGLTSLIVVPILVAIFGFVGAAILFVIWKLMGSGESYETAYRCCAYVGALAPVNAILMFVPYAGAAAGIALMTFLLVTASVEVHALPVKKAWLVFGAIGALMILGTVNAELTARSFQRRMENSAAEFQKEIGKSAAELEAAAKDMQKASEAAAKGASDAARALTEEMQKAQKEMEEQARAFEKERQAAEQKNR